MQPQNLSAGASRCLDGLLPAGNATKLPLCMSKIMDNLIRAAAPLQVRLS